MSNHETEQPKYLRATQAVDNAVGQASVGGPSLVQTSPKEMLGLMKRNLEALYKIENELVDEIRKFDQRLNDVRTNIHASGAAINAIEERTAVADKPSTSSGSIGRY